VVEAVVFHLTHPNLKAPVGLAEEELAALLVEQMVLLVQ
tara:strand:+ start:649 stop:765 length:117 start_codon:yes stop_codon:yes gene_type:complete